MAHIYWEIELFSGPRVKAGTDLIRLKASKTGELLAYLTLYPYRHTRDHLAATIWPNGDDLSVSKASLRTALASLSRQLEPRESKGRLLAADNVSICLVKDLCHIDTQAFLGALKQAQRSPDRQTRLDQYDLAFTLYTGPLLPGLDSDWIHLERLAFAEAHETALLQYTELLMEVGQTERALVCALQLLRSDPADEEATRLVMRAHAEAGRKTEALKAFARLNRALAAQYNSTPSLDLCDLAKSIQHMPASRKTPVTLPGKPVLAVPPKADGDEKPSDGLKEVSLLPPRNPAFFGRSENLWQIVGLLSPLDPPDVSQIRLVTLTGMGGIGKSRLALEAATLLQPKFARFARVSLAAISDPRLIAEQILQDLSIPRHSEVDAVEQLIEKLDRRPILLLLDNFEQLLSSSPEVADGATLLARLMNRLPLLRLLVTSRCPLKIAGETEIVVLPLRFPPPEVEEMAEICAFPAVQLYLRRAQEKRADFTVTERTASGIAALCRKLEGIPLALELAAACIHDYSPSRILTEFDRRFDFLKSRFRDMSERHQTLYAAIDWSFQTLSPEQQQFFCTLSAFRGSFTSEAAVSVSGSADAPEYLKHLQNQSLLIEDRETKRFCQFDTLRDFALRKLSAEQKRQLSRRHALYFYRLAKRTAFQITSIHQERLLEMLDAENDNLRASLDFLVGSRAGLRMTGALHQFWHVHGHHEEGLRCMEQALERCRSASPKLRTSILNGMGVFAWQIGDYGKAEEFLNQSLQCRIALQDDLAVAGLKNNLGLLARIQGNPRKANELMSASIDIFRRLGEKRLLAGSLDNLAAGCLELGELDTVGSLLDECQTLLEEKADNSIFASMLANRARLARAQGKLPQAYRLFQRALRLREGLKAHHEVVSLLLQMALLASHERRIPRCVILCGAVVKLAETAHWKLTSDDNTTLDACLEQARRSLSPNRYAGSWSTGYAFTCAQAIDFACDMIP